ncbi:uncharacterized protein LOC122085124 isoform X2 [Macadamia integrifolia]|uniref:uncharacterized protein LOC122085124 isoform X2 n=2 Tax=Macadamia integrifolia TaxID=60698 RepID=UPI001C4F8E9D|nr:uncharacterized protein LOC122085124 isoform X2 [Macadamia integrifolia]
MGGGVSNSRSSSSGGSSSEDGDAEWRAAIDSAATMGFGISTSKGLNAEHHSKVLIDDTAPSCPKTEEDMHDKCKPQTLKLYQIKAQKLLEDFLDKSLVLVRKPISILEDDHLFDEGGVQLFRQAPPGIVFDPVDEVSRPRKRPKLCPGELIDEKSEKFRRQLQSVVVDGPDIMASARDACQKSLARFEASIAKAKAASKQEEERVAELKRIRGEKWLPSIAREMQISKKYVPQR